MLPELLLIQDQFIRLGRKFEIVEISNKIESAIGKGKMLLNLIRIWWSVDLGCTSVELH